MKILGVESSATSASVSVVENGKVIALESSNTGLTHSQTLMPMVESTLKKATATINDIDYIAVSNGPGSFTGIRIGVSLVKGLSDPLNKKCVAVSTLEAIAKPLENTGVIAVSVMDARCNQVYCALFDCAKNEMKRLTDDDAISIDEFIILIICGTAITIIIASITTKLDSINAICLLISTLPINFLKV